MMNWNTKKLFQKLYILVGAIVWAGVWHVEEITIQSIFWIVIRAILGSLFSYKVCQKIIVKTSIRPLKILFWANFGLLGGVFIGLGFNNDYKIIEASLVNFTPLIKANITLSSAAYTSSHCACNKIRINHRTASPKLSEKYVLCIGGRSRLYPEYRCLVESLGGNLLTYRGNQKGDVAHLPALLTCADMVVCPVDCVNHETYFAVKYFCNKSGKPCALLDRSDLPTFRKGIEILVGIST